MIVVDVQVSVRIHVGSTSLRARHRKIFCLMSESRDDFLSIVSVLQLLAFRIQDSHFGPLVQCRFGSFCLCTQACSLCLLSTESKDVLEYGAL